MTLTIAKPTCISMTLPAKFTAEKETKETKPINQPTNNSSKIIAKYMIIVEGNSVKVLASTTGKSTKVKVIAATARNCIGIFKLPKKGESIKMPDDLVSTSINAPM